MQQPASNGHIKQSQSAYTLADAVASNASLPLLCANVSARLATFLEFQVQTPELSQLQKQTRASLNVITKALDQYSLEHLSLSYNGGKDCLVLLILYLAALHTHCTSLQSPSGSFPASLKSIYILHSDPFEEVETFVRQTSQQYHLDLTSSSLPMRAAFSNYIGQNPDVQAIFVGTRRTDPHGQHLTHFDETDRGWPKFMRIHPVIDWHYREIWDFIRYFEIPYCPLYDLGYTSLGSTTDTHPNPALISREADMTNGESGAARYRPAYQLIEDSEERLGRTG